MLCTKCDDAIHCNAIFRKHARTALAVTDSSVNNGSPTKRAAPHASTAVASPVNCLPVPAACRRHGDHTLHAYCPACRTSVCSLCATELHRGHALVALDDAVRSVADSVPRAVSVFRSTQERLLASVQAVETRCQDVRQSAAAAKGEVNHTFDQLARCLEVRRQYLLSRVDDAADAKLGLLDAQHTSLATMLESLERSRDLCQVLTTHTADFPLAELVDIGAHIPAFAAFVQSQRLDVAPCTNDDISVSFESDRGGAATDASHETIKAMLGALGTVRARAVAERTFAFTGVVADHEGVLYFLGTSRGIKLYENPLLSGRVKVAASSIGYGALEGIVGDGPADFCTQNENLAWVSIELEAPLCISGYALHHDAYDPESHFLRSWELQGWRAEQPHSQGSGMSCDDAVCGGGGSCSGWDVLAAHHNDKSISQRCANAAWAVSSCRPEGYRRFRLLQTGANSHGNHYLMISGLELYGKLLG
jgi:hypothetical protein